MSYRSPIYPADPALKPPAAISAAIEVRGARQNNLKGFDVDLPLGQLIVVTGPSGSGKSSFAFDTIYAEGQRRYIETFSPYTRQFFERMDKPQVDDIRGIPPAIAIQQSNAVRTTRSTVGTLTEINDYLKLFFPRLATALCPGCAREVRPETPQHVAEVAMRTLSGQEILVVFAVPVPARTAPADFFGFLQSQGFLRVRIFGEIYRTDDGALYPRKTLPARVDVIQDRLKVATASRARPGPNSKSERPASRLFEAIEQAFHFGKGQMQLIAVGSGEARAFSRGWHCAHCDAALREPTPGLFSFNSPLGACPECRGFGRTIGLDLDRALPDKSLSLRRGAVKAFQGAVHAECQRDLLRCARSRGIDINTPFEEMPPADQKWVLEGEVSDPDEAWRDGLWYGVRGFFRWLEGRAYKMHVRVFLSRFRAYTKCPKCEGGRLQPEALNFQVGGETLPDWWQTPVTKLVQKLAGLENRVPEGDSTAEMLRQEIVSRLGYLDRVGLGYLTLDRSARTLSGGEVERVNLTSCLGASLVNTLFVMDEPSIGLHPRDVGRLIDVMRDLRDKGNTLLVVEHDEALVRAADQLIDIGPGRGPEGGSLVYQGPVEGQHSECRMQNGDCEVVAEVPNLKSEIRERHLALGESLTLQYLSGRKSIGIPQHRRNAGASRLRIVGASQHNLKNVDVEIPLGLFVCLTGVSGSGKSTLVHEVLYENLLRLKGRTTENEPGHCKTISGAEGIGHVLMVDQSPLSRTPRSTPAVYIGAFDGIRALFAATPEARSQGLTASYFSFNSGTGRCQRCSGAGAEKVEMQFLSDLFVTCPACDGTRYTPAALAILLDAKSIADVLDLTVAEAIAFFRDKDERVVIRLQLLAEVGLEYLKLGQPLNTLSGGESQRLKLVAHLADAAHQRFAGKPMALWKRQSAAGPAVQSLSVASESPEASTTLLIFDEPTTGLHFDDVRLLLEVFQRLVTQGYSLLVIEHNIEVIKSADWVIDLGPEAGEGGGRIVATGTPEDVARIEESHTGRFLRRSLGSATVAELSGALQQKAPLKTALRPATKSIVIHGAREHNLKNLTIEIPRDQFVVITGLSGSGKSTLAFDILFAEGQRRFLDSMSPYARQFVQQLERPDVDHIEGLPPTVAIEQRLSRGGGKSTVATVTEVYHFLRLLFSKVGTQFCPTCEVPVTSQTPAEMARSIAELAKSSPVGVLATIIKARKGFHDEVARWAASHGFDHLLVDGLFIRTADFKRLPRFKEHTIDVVVAEFGAGTPPVGALQHAIERALEIGKGSLRVFAGGIGGSPMSSSGGPPLRSVLMSHSQKAAPVRSRRRGPGADAQLAFHVFSSEMTCAECARSFEPLDPRLFSFNSPHGWCAFCRGFGTVPERGVVTPERPDQSLLEAELRDELRHEQNGSESTVCPSCNGARLAPVARAVRVLGHTLPALAAQSISAVRQLVSQFEFTGRDAFIARDILSEIGQRLQFMEKVGLGYLALDRAARTLSGGESQRIRLAAQLGSNLRGVLYILDEPTIGLHPRDNEKLLATLAALRDKGNSVIVVEHDEATMRCADHLYDLGPGAGQFGGELVASGTLEALMQSPRSPTGAALKLAMKHPLRGQRRPVTSPARPFRPRGSGRRKAPSGDEDAKPARWLHVTGACVNNLKDIAVDIPLGRLVGITGVSGSGKSSLMRGILHPAVKAALSSARGGRAAGLPSRLPSSKNRKLETSAAGQRSASQHWRAITGAGDLDAVYEVDQSPIGKTSRSCPATYIGVFDDIRKLFAGLPVSRLRGYTASRFSFNTQGGRCETCQGNGEIKLEMAFLPTSWLLCEDCHGLRYNAPTLEVDYNGRSIGEVMRMTIEEAVGFFSAVSQISRTLKLLVETGLGYLQLGQPSPTLSGGEAQRIKLVTELTKGIGRSARMRLRQNLTPKGSLYLIEEPTIGLHMSDVRRLIDVLHRLVDDGHTVVVIEHNLEVIAEADHVIDMGPEAGAGGGEIVAAGTPEEVAEASKSRTAPFLREALDR
ncbi:MAG: excinuclease ABC subunit UvrA [Verrucomicrobiales bacterium]